MASNASSPLIGLTTYVEQASFGFWDLPSAVLPGVYLDGVTAVGGTPILLPPATTWEAAHLSGLDGLIVVGGADIDPARYGAARDPATGPARADRDTAESDLVALALKTGLPLLGVCRGLQMLNVVLGGTLHQHLPDVVGTTDHVPRPGTFGEVGVRIAEGSRLAGILGEQVDVRCHHHQAIDRLGEGLVPVAWAADGTVEAVELPGETFCLGVQWHPEMDVDRRLFAALVEEARR